MKRDFFIILHLICAFIQEGTERTNKEDEWYKFGKTEFKVSCDSLIAIPARHSAQTNCKKMLQRGIIPFLNLNNVITQGKLFAVPEVSYIFVPDFG